MQRMRGRDLQLGGGAIHGLLGQLRQGPLLSGRGELVHGLRHWSLPSVHGAVAVFVVRERPVPNCDGRHELHQLPCRDCVGVVGCVRLDDMRRVQRRVLLGGRGLGLHELLDGDLPVVKRGELVRSVCCGILLRVDGPLGVRLVRVRSRDLLQLRRDVMYVVRCRAVLGRDGVDVPFMPERAVPDGDRRNVLRFVRFGVLQRGFGANDDLLGQL